MLGDDHNNTTRWWMQIPAADIAKEGTHADGELHP